MWVLVNGLWCPSYEDAILMMWWHDITCLLGLLFGICHCSLDGGSDEADRKRGSERDVTCDKGQRLELSQRWLQSCDVRCNHLAAEVLPLVVFCQTSDSIHISLQRQVGKPRQTICHACCERKTTKTTSKPTNLSRLGRSGNWQSTHMVFCCFHTGSFHLF